MNYRLLYIPIVVTMQNSVALLYFVTSCFWPYVLVPLKKIDLWGSCHLKLGQSTPQKQIPFFKRVTMPNLVTLDQIILWYMLGPKEYWKVLKALPGVGGELHP